MLKLVKENFASDYFASSPSLASMRSGAMTLAGIHSSSPASEPSRATVFFTVFSFFILNNFARSWCSVPVKNWQKLTDNCPDTTAVKWRKFVVNARSFTGFRIRRTCLRSDLRAKGERLTAIYFTFFSG